MLFEKLPKKKLLLIAVTSLNAQFALATDTKPHPWKDQPSFEPSYVVTIGAGPIWANPGETQILFLAPNIEKAYIPDNSSQVLAEGELFFGLVRSLSPSFQGQLGLAVAATNNAVLTGVIWDDAFYMFDNYLYQYKLNHTHIALKGKLLANQTYFVTPWISASLGVAFNQAQDYFDTPTIPEAVTNPAFDYNIKTAFTYTLGAGIQKNLTNQIQVGIGYEFSDWGSSQLGVAPSQTLNSGLRLGHFYTSGVTINASYLF